MKKMLILATGEVEEFDDSYAQRLFDQGKAVYVAEEKAVQAEVTVADRIPEAEEPAEEVKPAEETKPAKGKKSK